MSGQQQNTAVSARKWTPLRISAYVLGLALLVGLFFAARWFFTCPCDRMPGAVLWGEVVEEPVSDWSFANEVELCQIQVQGIFPQANNLNCMATPDGKLYLSCSDCEPKRWSRLARNNENGRIRLNGLVYPVTIRHVTDPIEIDRSWAARNTKLGSNAPRPPDAQWWTFRIESRTE
ncbi:MAG: hypothetical protein LBE21_10470 [Pseudomonadales bacterium]|jgi:hypothetical protein|nr:hypothetical protein [Pseudomonadales bacterium]